MTGRKHIAALLGAILFITLGALAASRAQQPTDGAAARPIDKKTLRAKLVELRTEVEILEMEHEVARTNLVVAMRKQSEVARKFEEEMKEVRAKLTEHLAKLSKDELAKLADKVINEHGIKRLEGEDDAAMLLRAEIVEDARRQFYDAEGADLTAFNREKVEFVRQTVALNEKRFDLADREAEYKALK